MKWFQVHYKRPTSGRLRTAIVSVTLEELLKSELVDAASLASRKAAEMPYVQELKAEGYLEYGITEEKLRKRDK